VTGDRIVGAIHELPQGEEEKRLLSLDGNHIISLSLDGRGQG